MRLASEKRDLALALAALAVVSSLGCSDTTEPKPSPAPASLAVVAGDMQTGVLGETLPESLAVKALGKNGSPLAGVTVAWAAAGGGGALSAPTSTTNAEGIARAAWTLGTRYDQPQTVTATAAGVPPVTLYATGTVPSVSLEKVGGDAQTVGRGTVAPETLRVRVQLPSGKPIIGIPVNWSVTQGNGTVTPALPQGATDATGVSRATWAVGTTMGTSTVKAAVGLVPVTFSANVTPGAGSQLTIVSGNNQSGVAGGALSNSVIVQVTDGSGAPVQGVTVSWTPSNGGRADGPTYTDTQGRTTSYWGLGCTAGVQTLTAQVAGLTPVTFGATARAGAVANIQLTGLPASAPVGSSHTVTVTPTDQCGNPVSGYSYGWTIMPDPATGQPNTGLTISPMTATTDSTGHFSHTVTLGPKVTMQCAYILGPGAAKYQFCIDATAASR